MAWRAAATGWAFGAVLLCQPVVNAQRSPLIAEVRVHGNHTTPDAEVRRLAGLTPGQTAEPATIDAARARLLQSGRFPSVEMRVRQRSLDAAADVSVIIVVAEHPAVTPVDLGLPDLPGPLGRLRRSTMFLPILDYTDGYGLTYGARVSFVDVLGPGGRLSVPATWGGTRQVTIEADRTFVSGPLTRLRGRAGLWRREHPFYRVGETREEIEVEASRRAGTWFGAGVIGSVANVRFGDLDERTSAVGAFAEVDTRGDPLFPRHAVYARASVARLGFDGTGDVVRLTTDVRGYLGLYRNSVLAARVQTVGTDGPTPPYAQVMLGGASTLRGMRAGSFVGDNLFAGSLELRVPFSSPLRTSRTGIAVFYDGGVAYQHGQHWRDRRFERGVGAGLFMVAPFFQVRIDVARGIDRSTRVHVTTGINF